MNNEFIERMIYENEKNTPFKNIKSFYRYVNDHYKIVVDSDVYKRIMNYQIDTYGHSLNYDDKERLYRSDTDMRILTKNANARRYARRKRK